MRDTGGTPTRFRYPGTSPAVYDILFGMGAGLRLVGGMALFRLEAKVFSREKRGRSVIAAAAYRAGTKLMDEVREKTFDYTRRVKGVIQSMILAPEGAPAWVFDSGQLWNTVERSEKRVDAQLAREFILAVPPELSAAAQFKTAVDWAKKELVTSGMVAEVSLHHTKTGKNPHVHILCTMRKLDGEKFSSKKSTEWNDVKLLVKQRESWAEAVNAALEKAGRNERVDHRSLKDRGIDRVPEPKIGVAATAMKRRGFLDDPERFQAVRLVKMLNAVRPMMKAIKERGEIYQVGAGRSWWEKSITFMSRIREQADKVREKVLVESARHPAPDKGQRRAANGDVRGEIMKIPDELKQRAMDAINNVNTIKQIGMLKTLGGIALYAALIYEREREARNRPRKVRKDGRDV